MKYLAAVFFLAFGINSMAIHQLHAYQKPFFQSYSQASQDQFIYNLLYTLLGKNNTGYYLEIGAGHPVEINNTYAFEKNYGWKGISIDISSQYAAIWQATRENPLLTQDALQVDYDAILHPFPQVIDYLSLDIDGNYDLVLQKIPLQNYIFKIITIEHDFYRYGNVYRAKEREILSSLGYHLLCPDVSYRGLTFEDWWIHPSAFSNRMFSQLTSLDLEGKDHFQILDILKSVH